MRPAERIRDKLINGHGRLLYVMALTLVWWIDQQLSSVLLRSDIIGPKMQSLDQAFEACSASVYLVISLVLVIALFRPWPKLIVPVSAIYMVFAVLQLMANVLSMVLTAHVKTGIGLVELWDVAAVYAMSVVVFMMVYMLFDVTTPGGAFVWPARDGEEPPEPHLLDYLFISLNVNSTYGPTTEAVMSRPCKLVMALQTLLSVMMLTVLIARAVGATS